MTTIAFTGDIAFSKYFADGWQRDDLVAPEIVDFLSASDFTVPNVEAPVTDGSIKSSRSLNHANPTGAVTWLRRLNGNIWNLANNHMYDCGPEGLIDTLEIAAANGCQTVGAGRNAEEAMRPVILDTAGGIGLLSITYSNKEDGVTKDFMRAGEDKPGCILWDEEERIREAIRRVKQQCRWCVLIAHGGSEFSGLPLPFVRKRYLRYLDYGVDVIIGHHPHVLQNYEVVGDKTIFYSLGNFIFDTDYQRVQRYSDYGMVVKLHFTEESYTWEKLPVHIDREAARVVSCECPAIFRDVSPKMYRRLWPLMVHTFTQNCRRADCFLDAKYNDYTEWQWLRSLIIWQGFCPAMKLVAGRLLYHFGFWKRSDPVLVDYLKKG